MRLSLPAAAAEAAFGLGGPGSLLTVAGATAVRGPAGGDGRVPLTLGGDPAAAGAAAAALLRAARIVATGHNDDSGWTYVDRAGTRRGPCAWRAVERWARAAFWGEDHVLTDVASGISLPSGLAVKALGRPVAARAQPPRPPPADALADDEMAVDGVCAALAAAREAGLGGDAMDGVESGTDAARTAAAAAAAAPRSHPPSLLLVLDTNVLLTRLSLVAACLTAGGGKLAARAPWRVVAELDRVKAGRSTPAALADLAPHARAALASMSGRMPFLAPETLADARAAAAALPGGRAASPDDDILASCLLAASRHHQGTPVLVTLDRALAARARAAGVAAVPPRELPRSGEGVDALIAECCSAMDDAAGDAMALAVPLPPPPPQPPPPPGLAGAPPPSWQALAASLEDAIVDGLAPALAAALRRAHGALWADVAPDPPPWSAPATLAATRACWTGAVEDGYRKRGRARAARAAADAAARAFRGARGGRAESVGVLAAALHDLMADFPVEAASPEAAALAAARCAVAGVETVAVEKARAGP